MNFDRDYVVSILRENGMGALVGIRALVTEGVDSEGSDIREFTGWFVAGVDGYLELDTDGGVVLAGVWRPEELYSVKP
ncbi:hypothetical protein [Streptomyces cucumeris]|uniref:hypothetical protein n=1 Tax=Streptomyces cucumeris TaxID=2962890 RepID=UPI0020C8F9F7|nr:hypothetical protein [Streptomyces sp. NEAU-Y11]MCP9209545.1 hypothetical protein [Streptomyces sp. NEAU-Y11]